MLRHWRAAAGLALASCSLLAAPTGTEPPPCAPLTALGSIQLDYEVRPGIAPTVTAAVAEAAARRMTGGQGATCSVRLAKYDNLADHRPLVWVVHLDGLALPEVGGPLPPYGRPAPSPPTIRRALVLVTVDEPATPLTMLGEGR